MDSINHEWRRSIKTYKSEGEILDYQSDTTKKDHNRKPIKKLNNFIIFKQKSKHKNNLEAEDEKYPTIHKNIHSMNPT
jgi:hypothetical protein